MATAQYSFIAYIKDQPMQDYRFRFITEGARSILYSRMPHVAPRFPTACLVTDAAALPYVRGTVTVSVSTVTQDGLIHPFYLKGRDCEDGVLRKRVDFPAETFPDGRIGIVFELSDVAIICVKRNREALRQAIADRIRVGEIPYYHSLTERADEVYASQVSLLESVHLAFAFYHHQTGQHIKVITESINRAARAARQVQPPFVMPRELPLLQQLQAWLHIEGLAKASSYQIKLTSQNNSELATVNHTTPRANLFELNVAFHNHVDHLPRAERIQCQLRINDGAHEHATDVFFNRSTCPHCQQRELTEDLQRQVQQQPPPLQVPFQPSVLPVDDLMNEDFDLDLDFLDEISNISGLGIPVVEQVGAEAFEVGALGQFPDE